MTRVLVTDGLQRKSLVATRSLGRAGFEVDVADDRRLSLARWSRYCRAPVLSPAPQSPEYRDWLIAEARRYDLLLPMDDASTAAAIAAGSSLGAKTLLPTEKQFHTARDKYLTAELAEAAGVAHPRTVPVASGAEVHAARGVLGGEVVLRPRVGSGGRGVRFLAEGEGTPAGDWSDHIVQARVPFGRKYDVCLLYGRDGAVRARFCQEELRWFPGEQGTSTLQRSVEFPDLCALSERLLAPLGWRGMAEVEWMVPEGGEPLLLEVNPRPWASIGLAVAAGVDFPRLWAELAEGRDARGPDTYRTDVLCRWSLPADVLHFASHPLRGLDPEGPRRTPGERVVDDIVDGGDLMPAFGFVLAAFSSAFDPRMWRMVMRW